MSELLSFLYPYIVQCAMCQRTYSVAGRHALARGISPFCLEACQQLNIVWLLCQVSFSLHTVPVLLSASPVLPQYYACFSMAVKGDGCNYHPDVFMELIRSDVMQVAVWKVRLLSPDKGEY